MFFYSILLYYFFSLKYVGISKLQPISVQQQAVQFEWQIDESINKGICIDSKFDK